MLKPNLSKLPKKWNPFMVIVGLLVLAGIVGWIVVSKKTESPGVSQIQPARPLEQRVGGVGGEGTPEYNGMLAEENTERAERAANAGHSFIPTPVGKEQQQDSLLEMEDAPAPPPSQSSAAPIALQNHTSGQTGTGERVAELASYMNSVIGAMQDGGAAVSHSFKLPMRAIDAEREQEAAKEIPGAEFLAPGTILYASNDLTVSSQTPGAPVRATVIHGPLKGAVAVGAFTQSGERLVLNFNSLSKDGIAMQISGYGVDPIKAEAAVASEVDNQTFIKVVAFLASSFLEGWGTALQNTGITRTYNDYEQVTIQEKLNLSEQAQVAAGKMGERAAGYLERKIDEPPIVTLNAGTSLGILIVN